MLVDPQRQHALPSNPYADYRSAWIKLAHFDSEHGIIKNCITMVVTTPSLSAFFIFAH